MTELVRSVAVDASAEQTWEAATDWVAQGEWMPGTTVALSPGPASGHRGVGVRVVAHTGLGRLRFADPMEITLWDPPRRCEVRHDGRVVRGTGVFEVRALPGGRSEFVWSEQLTLPFGVVGSAGWRVLRPVVERGFDVALRRFAAWVPIHAARQ
jgi:hypothetical protein